MKLPRDWEVFSRVSFLLMVRFLAAKTQHILPTSEHAFVRFLVHTLWVRVPSEYVCSALVLAMIVFVWVNVPCCIYILNSHVFYQQICVLTKTTVINQTMLSLLNYWRRDPSSKQVFVFLSDIRIVPKSRRKICGNLTAQCTCTSCIPLLPSPIQKRPPLLQFRKIEWPRHYAGTIFPYQILPLAPDYLDYPEFNSAPKLAVVR